jgi:hypothetical protein
MRIDLAVLDPVLGMRIRIQIQEQGNLPVLRIRIRIRRIRTGMLLRPPGSECGYIIQRCGSGSFYHHAKIVRKPCFMILFDFLSLKNYVNVPSKSRYKHKNIFLN